MEVEELVTAVKKQRRRHEEEPSSLLVGGNGKQYSSSPRHINDTIPLLDKLTHNRINNVSILLSDDCKVCNTAWSRLSTPTRSILLLIVGAVLIRATYEFAVDGGVREEVRDEERQKNEQQGGGGWKLPWKVLPGKGRDSIGADNIIDNMDNSDDGKFAKDTPKLNSVYEDKGGKDEATSGNIMSTKSMPANMAYDRSERNKGETNTSSEKQASIKTHKDEDSHDFPSLQSLTDGKTVNGDVSWMLDFAISGFAKCGTTWMMNYLRKNGRNNGEMWVNQGEVHYMRKPDGPAKMVDLMYKNHKMDRLNGTKRIYGIKNPAEMEIEGSLERYANYFPNTKFIISLRHPVKWFESFFNFRQYHHYPNMIIRPTTKLIGECEPGYPYKPKCIDTCKSGTMDVCTIRANFHWALSRLGKTLMDTQKEKDLLQHSMSIVPMSNRVFLLDIRQITFDHPSAKNFTHDVKTFLGLESELAPLKPYGHGKYLSNKEAVEHLINICDEEHDAVREELVKIGKEAATWITEYFIESPDVFVSSKSEFIKLIEDYGRDPCFN